ncbi:MAG: 2-hydroxychromene-2-carboxylate isomerase [Aquisalimonadaceae bacterium]
MANLEFFFDIVCPQAWLAACRVEDVARQGKANLVLRPVSLEGIYHALNSWPPGADQWPVNKRRLAERDLLRRAELTGVTLRIPAHHPGNTERAMRLLAAAPRQARLPLMHALFRAYWAEGQDLDNSKVLAGLARSHGVDPNAMESTAARENLRQTTEEAVERGAFGVPTFMLEDQLWWGADRMDFLQAALGSTPPPRPVSPSETPATLEIFHDFSSPFSYLGSTQIEQLAHEHGAELTWRPMLLGALFRAIGTPMIPMKALSEERRAWARKDLHTWAEHWNVPFRFNRHFPLNSVLALRASEVEPRLVPVLYRAAWVDNCNLSEPEVVADVIRQAGYDPAPILQEAVTQPVKDAIRRNTETAQELGICGAPTFVVNGRMPFWGQDRLDMVARALDGWVPEVDRNG